MEMNDFADKNVNLVNRADDELTKVSVPSDLSDDVWGELPKFNYLKHQENLKKEKEALKRKRENVRATLDN